MRTLLPLLMFVACTDPGETAVRMDFAASDFYGAPFPSDHRLRDGKVDLSGFDDRGNTLAARVVALLDGQQHGFGTTSGVFFQLTGALDPSTLPSLDASDDSASPVLLLPIDRGNPDFGRRVPVTIDYREHGGPYGTDHLLTVLPVQGLPLRPNQRYAVALTTEVLDAGGLPLMVPESLDRLRRGKSVEGMEDTSTYEAAFDALEELGVEGKQVVALAAFTTGDPTAQLVHMVEVAPAIQPPTSFTPAEVFEDYCVFEGIAKVPVYQSGEPPYLEEGGAILWSEGEPVLDHWEDARIVLTVPRGTAPESGWPAAVMIRAGGGGERPLVSRGPWNAEGELIEAGSGPARTFAANGIAGVSMDGPHGGIRNVSRQDEQFLVFNVSNPVALIDNLRQSALEQALLPALLDGVSLPATEHCGAVTFDTRSLALMGHSTGASIGQLVIALQPRYEAAVFSGSGGSWIENVVSKQKPLEVRPLAETMLDYDSDHLHRHDPLLSLLQWAGEPGDPPVYTRTLMRDGVLPDLLVFQGIIDHYIMPPIANAGSLGLGLDLVGPSLDADEPGLDAYLPLRDVIRLGGGALVDYPAEGNQSGRTAVVAQHVEDGIQDGHEVMFQLQAPKDQYGCFLSHWASAEIPVVPGPGAECP